MKWLVLFLFVSVASAQTTNQTAHWATTNTSSITATANTTNKVVSGSGKRQTVTTFITNKFSQTSTMAIKDWTSFNIFTVVTFTNTVNKTNTIIKLPAHKILEIQQ